MIREPLIEKGIGDSKRFRWRGGSVSRLEGFSDAVFGFSLTLLVVSTEVPNTFDGLMNVLRGFPAFAFCFAMLMIVWFRHYTFFRRYGLTDGITAALNSILLFLVVFYVYPLKFFYTFVTRASDGTTAVVALANGKPVPMITGQQVPQLIAVYGLGFAAVFVVFGLLHVNAYRQWRTLELNPLERIDTMESIVSSFALASIGLLSIAVIYGLHNGWLAGFTYALIGVVEFVIGSIMGVRRRRLEKKMDLAAPSAPPEGALDG